MKTKLSFSLVSLALLFLFTATTARADAIEIVSGTYVIQNIGAGAQSETANLNGNNLALSGMIGSIGLRGCFPCAAGAVVSASYSRSNMISSVTFNGITYNSPPFTIGSTLQFNSGSYVLPATNEGTFTISLPFTLTGHVFVRESPLAGGATLLDTDIFGDGIVTIEYSVVNISGRTLFTIERTTYDFGAPVPTPEPATLILFGSGLAGAALRFRKRRFGSRSGTGG